MTFGSEVWVDTLLAAVAGRLVTATGLSADCVFESLCSDDDHCAFPPADRFVTVRPENFPVDEPGVSGGGRYTTGFRGTLRTGVICRVATDQELRSARVLREKTRGVLALQLKVLSGLEMFAPVDAAGACYLREPMRVLSWDVVPKPLRSGSAWAVLGSTWELLFNAPLTHVATV